MRKSDIFFIYSGLLFALLLLSTLDAGIRSHTAAEGLARMGQQVSELELTDLSLFTEARYTRHTPFQDHPFALEHFPSGSLVTPPDLLRYAP